MKKIIIMALIFLGVAFSVAASTGQVCKCCDDCKCPAPCSCPK